MKKNLSKKTCLVTGGAGFIGSSLCKRLLEKDYRVIALDDLSTGSLENIDQLFKDERFTFINKDVRTVRLDRFQVHECYHLASLCGVPRVKDEPLEVMLVGLEGTLNVLKWAGRHQIRVLYVSSSEIYGNPSVHPQSEDYWGYTNPVGMRSPYVEAKRTGEALCRSFRLDKNLSIRVARLFNVYGPGFRADDSRVVPQFIQAAEAGAPLTIYGTGECTRSFCYVTDIVDGLIRLMEKDIDGIEEPVNLGFPEEIDIRKLAKIVIDTTGSKSMVLCVNPICDDLPRRLPDISKAQKYLDWSPKIGIEEGIEQTVKWFRQKLIPKPVKSVQENQ